MYFLVSKNFSILDFFLWALGVLLFSKGNVHGLCSWCFVILMVRLIDFVCVCIY